MDQHPLDTINGRLARFDPAGKRFPEILEVIGREKMVDDWSHSAFLLGKPTGTKQTSRSAKICFPSNFSVQSSKFYQHIYNWQTVSLPSACPICPSSGLHIDSPSEKYMVLYE